MTRPVRPCPSLDSWPGGAGNQDTGGAPGSMSTEPPSPVVAAPEAVAELYAELRKLARHHMGTGRSSTLQATALVNETYLRLRDRYAWHGRAAFLALASRAMRNILVDHARHRSATHGDRREDVALDAIVDRYETHSQGLLALDVALEQLAGRDPDMVRLVELRFFGGRSMDEVAEVMGVSPRQAARLWNTARGFLKRAIDGE